MQSADNFVQNYFLLTHLIEMVDALETVLFVNKFPNVRAIVGGEWLDVTVDIEVLSFVILLVFNMPDPLFLKL